MSFTMKDLLARQLESMKATQFGLINNLEEYVNLIKDRFFDPNNAPSWVVTNLNELSEKAWNQLEQIQAFLATDERLHEFISLVESQIERIIDLFWSWSNRKIINVKEAAELHGKHRSTIYRWIKKGKLDAEKVNGRWQIIS